MSTSVLESDKDLDEVCKAWPQEDSPRSCDKSTKETDHIREEIRTKHGTLDIAVELSTKPAKAV
jgi:hypothetical protein